MPQNVITPGQAAEVPRMELAVESARAAAESSSLYSCNAFTGSCFAEE